MSTADNLKDILSRQKKVLSDLEMEVTRIEASDLIAENENLKSQLAKNQILLEKQKVDNSKISEENKRLKNALYEQLYNEKVSILNAAGRKADVYYRANMEGEINRLISFEIAAKKRIDDMTRALRENRIEMEDEIYKRLDELQGLLDIKVTQARQELSRQMGTFSHNRTAEFEQLKKEQLTEEEIKGRLKQNNFESLIGLNIINKLGILLLVIGVIAASQFTYFRLPDTLKGAFAFAVGGILLVIGELLNRRKPNIFSLGITSGGVAILYVALGISYFGYKILGMYPALGLCVLITFGSFVLSQRYNSQTISVFAMIGGYLPIFSTSGSKTLIYGAMVYFIILNILDLLISTKKKWPVTAFTGFILSVGGSLYIMDTMFSSRSNNGPFSIDDLITILYIILAFVIYTVIPIAGTYLTKLKFRNSDIVLIAFNTVISSLLLYAAFYAARLSDFTGLLAVIFAGAYLLLGRFVEVRMSKEQKVQALFYITGLTFVVLIVPLQFGRIWLSLGWLVEGVILLAYGIFKEEKAFKRAGVIISLLCFAAFLLFDVSSLHEELFIYKYLSITIGSIVILASLTYKKSLSRISARLFKYGAALNLWIFLMYITGDKIHSQLSRILLDSRFNAGYLIHAIMIVVSFILAYAIPRIKILYDRVMKVISMVIYITAVIFLFILNFNSPVRENFTQAPLAVSMAGTFVLVLIALLSVLVVKDLIYTLVIEKKLGIEWYPLIVSSYFIIILTQNLITQYNLGFNNAVISIIYVIAALAWIIFGFVRRYALIRRFGLGLSMLAVAKLFIIDLSFLSQGYRIVSYFAFGMTLIAISFVYQYFSKRIETVSGVMTDD